MKVKVLAAVVVLVLAGLLVNAAVAGRAHRAAEAFGGGRVLDLPGPDLNVREFGRSSADEAIVLLHGYSASVQWWDKVAPELAAGGTRVIAIDLVGHGGSEAPSAVEAYGAAGQVGAVRQALAALGLRRVVLVGHSMGGAVATAVAEAEPDMVDRVVVSDTPGDIGMVAVPRMRDVVCAPLVGPAVDQLRRFDVVDESSLQTGFAADYPVPDFAYRSLQRLTHTGVCDSDVADELNAGQAIADRLAGLGKPVLVVWGERDVLTPTAANVGRYTAAGLPPHVIAGSGHSPMVEKPGEFLSAIEQFVGAAGGAVTSSVPGDETRRPGG